MAKHTLVYNTPLPPQKCAVFPQLGSSHERGYLDTGLFLNGADPHVYVSVVAIEDMGTQIGMLTQAENERICSELATAHEKIIELERELNDVANVLDAIDSIESVGFRARKKPGRKSGPQNKKTDFEDVVA